MERQLLVQLYRWLMSLSLVPVRRVQFSDRWIALGVSLVGALRSTYVLGVQAGELAR